MLRRCRLLSGWSYMASTWAWVCSLGESTTRSAPDSANSSVEMLTTAADNSSFPLKSCMLNEDFTEVEWVRQTDQVLVIKDRCSARVAAPVPKEPEQLPGPNRARIVQERASTPLRLHRRQAWGKKEST